MKNTLILSLITFFFVGCSYGYIDLEPNTIKTTPYIEFKVPSSPPEPFITLEERSNYTIIDISRRLPYMTEYISFQINDRRELVPSQLGGLLDKKGKEYVADLTLDSRTLERDNEFGNTYRKDFTVYIAGLKCPTGVWSSSYGEGIGVIESQSTCWYFDKKGNVKNLHVTYDLTYSKGDGKKKFKEINLQFKKDMKEMFDSIVIYDMDLKRMKEEELIHTNKYDINSESRAMNIAMDCNILDYDSETWVYYCKGVDKKNKSLAICTLIRTPGERSKFECKYVDNHGIDLEPNTIKTTPYMEFKVPSSLPKEPFIILEESSDHTRIDIRRKIPYMTEYISFQINDRRGLVPSQLGLLDKKGIKEHVTDLTLESNILEMDHYNRTKYRKAFTEYIAGLKCPTVVRSRDFGPALEILRYQSTCWYFAKEGDIKNLHITYKLSYSKEDDEKKFKEISLEFKKDMKEIFDSIVIYDMDLKRMKEEELIHTNKYDINSENGVMNTAMDCYMFHKNNRRDENKKWFAHCKGVDEKNKNLAMCTLISEKGKDERWECKYVDKLK